MSGEYFRVGFRFETPHGARLIFSQVVWADDVMGALAKGYDDSMRARLGGEGCRVVEAGALTMDLQDVGLPPQWPLMQLWHEGQDGEHDDEPDGQPDEQDDPQVERGAVPRPRQPGE